MIPSLAPIFSGELAPYAKTLVSAHDPRPAIAGTDLTKPSVLDDIMRLAAAHIGDGDLRAQMSLWCIDYVHVLMPVTVVANLVLNRQMPLKLEDIAVILDDEGMPEAIRLCDDGITNETRDAFAAFDPMIRGNLQPLIEAWSAYSGISPRVLWTNAANLYEAILRGMEKLPDVSPGVIAEAERLITSSHWPDHWRNPFLRPVVYRPDHPTTRRWRRICCVRYLIPRYKYCSNCPHLLAMTGRAPDVSARG